MPTGRCSIVRRARCRPRFAATSRPYDDEARRAGVAASSSRAHYFRPPRRALHAGEGPRSSSARRSRSAAWSSTVPALSAHDRRRASRFPHTDEEEATDKIAAGLVLYPLAVGSERRGPRTIGGELALAVFLVALFPAGFFALAWHDAAGARRPRGARAFARFLGDRGRRPGCARGASRSSTELRALVARTALDAPGENRTE